MTDVIMIVALFKTELRKEADGPEYEETDKRVMELVSGMPGLLSIKSNTEEDGEGISIVRFTSDEALPARR